MITLLLPTKRVLAFLFTWRRLICFWIERPPRSAKSLTCRRHPWNDDTSRQHDNSRKPQSGYAHQAMEEIDTRFTQHQASRQDGHSSNLDYMLPNDPPRVRNSGNHKLPQNNSAPSCKGSTRLAIKKHRSQILHASKQQHGPRKSKINEVKRRGPRNITTRFPLNQESTILKILKCRAKNLEAPILKHRMALLHRSISTRLNHNSRMLHQKIYVFTPNERRLGIVSRSRV